MTEPVRRTGNARRTKHLDEPQAPAVRSGHGGQDSGNPVGLRRSRNSEDLLARRIRALELRVQGYGYREIGVELGIAAYTAHGDVKKMLQLREADAVNEARTLEEARLDQLMVTALAIANDPARHVEVRLKAIDRAVRVSTQRANMLGLNMPTQLSVQVTELTQADIELQELLAEAEARNAATLAQITDDPGSAQS